MVRQGDFDVQLVEATSKERFPEHTKDGMHFVEAEPNADYFVRLERIPHHTSNIISSPCLITCIKVDGLNIDNGFVWRQNHAGQVYYFGPRSRQDGTKMIHSLRFSPPDRFESEEQSFSLDRYLEKIGRVDVYIHEAIQQLETNATNIYNNCTNQKSCFQKHHEDNRILMVPMSQDGGEKDKFVLSKTGRQSMMDPTYPSSFRCGECKYVVTLRYCTAKGLILAGVLSSPGPSPNKKPRYATSSGEESTATNYHTKMQQILGDPTPNGNVPYRAVEVIVFDDESSEDDD